MDTLSDRLLHYLYQNKDSWVHSGEFERMQWKNRRGTVSKPSTVSRALRLLEQERKIAVKYEGAQHSALYKYIPKHMRPNYVPTAMRGVGKENEFWRKPLKEFLAQPTLV